MAKFRIPKDAKTSGGVPGMNATGILYDQGATIETVDEHLIRAFAELGAERMDAKNTEPEIVETPAGDDGQADSEITITEPPAEGANNGDDGDDGDTGGGKVKAGNSKRRQKSRRRSPSGS